MLQPGISHYYDHLVNYFSEMFIDSESDRDSTWTQTEIQFPQTETET